MKPRPNTWFSLTDYVPEEGEHVLLARYVNNDRLYEVTTYFRPDWYGPGGSLWFNGRGFTHAMILSNPFATQEGMNTITAKAEIDHTSDGKPFLRLSLDNMLYCESFAFYAEQKIIHALKAGKDDKITVTFSLDPKPN